MTKLPTSEELLARLVSTDSTSRLSNRPLAELIANYLDRPGITVELDETGDKVNLLARLGPETTDGAGLTLSGHMDTVPADEPDWDSDPFFLQDADDRWVARGSCDMKGFLALAIERAMRLDPARLSAPLLLLFTCDEELGSLGAQRFVRDMGTGAGLPRATLIGEPTELAVVRMHKGHLRARLTFTGVSAHSGYPHRGVNAIEDAGRAIAALSDLSGELRDEAPPSGRYFPSVPFVALNVARVEGGGAVNVVPDHCRVDFGLRLLPGNDPDELLSRVRTAVSTTRPRAEWTIEPLNLSPPMSCPADAPLHRELCELAGQEGTVAVSYSSDGGALSKLGLDCVLYGPGSIEVAHKPNEFLPKDEFETAGVALEGLISRLCGPA